MPIARDHTIDELAIVTMARELKGEILVGGGTFCGMFAVALAKRLYAPELMPLAAMDLIDMPAVPGYFAPEFLAYESAKAAGFGVRISMEELFVLITRGKWMIWVGPAQLDQYGNSNISAIGPWDKPVVQLVGARGLPDNSVYNEHMYYFVSNHSTRTLIPKVDFICGVGNTPDRAAGIIKRGSPGVVVTNLATLDFDETSGRMRLRTVHPGLTVDDVVKNTGFELIINGPVPQTPEPTEEEVRLIREELDPLGLRKLEFMKGRELQSRLETLAAEEQALLSKIKSGSGSN